jgi:CRP/FNR family transcriptional regulator
MEASTYAVEAPSLLRILPAQSWAITAAGSGRARQTNQAVGNPDSLVRLRAGHRHRSAGGRHAMVLQRTMLAPCPSGPAAGAAEEPMAQDPAVLDLNQLRRSCSSCALSELCLPAGIDGDDLDTLDMVIRDKRMLDRGSALYRDGDPFHALYVVRSGSLKTFVQDDTGAMQILGFHLPGDIIGFDALASDRHVSQAEALERSSICELPYDRLQHVTSAVPALHRQLMRVVSREVIEEHRHTVVMGRQQAQEQLAIFLTSLSDRYQRLHRDSTTLTLSMSRYDIANYLGLVVETVSRLFSRMQEMGVLEVNRKAVRICRPDLLANLCRSGSTAAAKDSNAG